MGEYSLVAVVESLNLAAVREIARLGPSGIDKRPAAHPARISADGVEGDSVLNRRHHGGPDKAAYAYAGEDADWWGAALSRTVPPGAFGENLTTRGIDVTHAVVGSRWRVGTALLEVAQPRIPCNVFRTFWDLPDLIKRFTAAGRPGGYLRVVEPGRVQTGDGITVLDVPAHGVTLNEVFRAVNGDVLAIPHVLQAAELPAQMRARLRDRLARVQLLQSAALLVTPAPDGRPDRHHEAERREQARQVEPQRTVVRPEEVRQDVDGDERQAEHEQCHAESKRAGHGSKYPL